MYARETQDMPFGPGIAGWQFREVSSRAPRGGAGRVGACLTPPGFECAIPAATRAARARHWDFRQNADSSKHEPRPWFHTRGRFAPPCKIEGFQACRHRGTQGVNVEGGVVIFSTPRGGGRGGGGFPPAGIRGEYVAPHPLGRRRGEREIAVASLCVLENFGVYACPLWWGVFEGERPTPPQSAVSL